MRGAREHNLKNVSVSIPRNRLTVITGLSGSGKSSLAFDTIYAEGQRRYVESLSAYARQFLGLMEKPDVDAIEGLSPAISIEQKTTGQNPRSTVGTVTEIYDYLRLLWARVGIPHCPNDGTPVARQSATQITDAVLAWPADTRIEVLAPIVRGRKGEFRDLLDDVRKRGFVRVRVDGETYDLADVPALNRRQNHDIGVVVDRLVVRAEDRSRLNDSIETALKTADGIVEVVRYGRGASERQSVTFSERFACPGLRALAARAGATAVLVQLTIRRVSGLPRRRHPPRGERRSGAGRPQHLHPGGRDPPLGRAHGLPPQGGAADARQGVQVRSQRALGRAQRRGAAGVAPRSARPVQVPDRRCARPGRIRERLGGRPQERRAALSGVGQRRGAHGARGIHDRAAVPDLRRQAPQGGKPRRAGERPRHRRCGRAARRARGGVLPADPAARAPRRRRGGQRPRRRRGRRDRGPDPEGSGRPAELPPRRGAGLPDARSGGDLALRRRDPAHPARDPDRLAARGRALHPRRAEHRPAPAGQRAPARPRSGGSATLAIPSSWWSTTRIPSRRPTT